MAFIKPQWKTLYDVVNIPVAQAIEPLYGFKLSFAVHYGIHQFLYLIFNILTAYHQSFMHLRKIWLHSSTKFSTYKPSDVPQ